MSIDPSSITSKSMMGGCPMSPMRQEWRGRKNISNGLIDGEQIARKSVNMSVGGGSGRTEATSKPEYAMLSGGTNIAGNCSRLGIIDGISMARLIDCWPMIHYGRLSHDPLPVPSLLSAKGQGVHGRRSIRTPLEFVPRV